MEQLNEPAQLVCTCPDKASPANTKPSGLCVLLPSDSITSLSDTKMSDIDIFRQSSIDSMWSMSMPGYTNTESNCTPSNIYNDCPLSPDFPLSPINKHQALRNKTYNKHRFLYPKTFNNNPPVLSDIQHIPSAGHIMTQCPTNKGTGSAGNNASNHKNNNDGNKASDNSGNGWNNRGGSRGNNNRGWKGRDGDDEKKRENNINMDKYDDYIKDEEEEDDEEEDDEFVEMNCTPTHKPTPYAPLNDHNRSKSLNSVPNRQNTRIYHTVYQYTACPGYRAQGFIIISKKLTETIIPKRIKEHIQNVYDFMDKTTGIIWFNQHILYVGNFQILNYGFHCKLHGDELYLVTERKKNSKIPYKMRDNLFTKQEICDMFKVNEHELPKSFVDLNRDNVANDMAILSDIFADDAFYKNVFANYKQNKLPVFRGTKGKKDYNKRRITFSLTKSEFLSAVKSSVSGKMIKVIPMIMFSVNGYRLEYLHIVNIEREKSTIDIGISYAFDPYYNRLEATGIHLDKRSILAQHQLIVPNHHCQCLDDFQCHIDDLHIGNPDDDKNRLKDLKSRNVSLQQKNLSLERMVHDQEQRIYTLQLQNIALMQCNISYTQMPALPTPISPSIPHIITNQLQSPIRSFVSPHYSSGSSYSTSPFQTPDVTPSSTTSTTFSLCQSGFNVTPNPSFPHRKDSNVTPKPSSKR